MTRRVPTWAVVLGLAACLLAGWSLLARAVPAGDRAGDRVVVIGDSITALGEPQLSAELLKRYELSVNAEFGATIADMLPTVQRHAEEGADQVVVNLGTNDVIRGTGANEAAHAVGQLLAELSDVECVYLVTVTEHLEVDGVTGAEGAAMVNAVLADAARGRPHVSLIRWDRAHDAAVRTTGDSRALMADGVHPDAEGQQLIAEGYANALDRCGRPWWLP